MEHLDGNEADALFSVLNSAEPEFVLSRLEYLEVKRVLGFPETLFEYDTDHNHAWYLMGLVYEKMGKLDRASKAFKTAIDVWPNDSDSYVALSNTGPLTDDTIYVLRQGVNKTNDDRIKHNLANLLILTNQLEDAKKYLKMISPSWDSFEDVKRLLLEISSQDDAEE